MTPKAILLATDLSPRCDRALDRATSLAAEWHARLIVLHALQEPAVSRLPSWRQPPDPLRAALQRVRRDVRGAGAVEGVEIDVIVEQGEPAPLILDAIERTGCELVVTGVARDETLGRILLGTTVEELARKIRVPMLVVKSRPRWPYRNVVVATDFSRGSRCALGAALELLPAARFTLFHAYDISFLGLVDDRMEATVRESAGRQALAESRAFLAATPAVAGLGHSITPICEYGDPGLLLRDLAQAREVDLVVLGTEGRRGLPGMLLGSVAQRLLSSIPVDALLVRRRRD